MAYINITTDLDEAIALMGDLVKNEDKMRASLLGQIGTKAKNAAKRNYRNVLNKRSGDLYRSIRRTMYRNKKAVYVTAHNKDDKVRYGFMLAHGFTSEAKGDDGYLTFQIDGKWVKVHSTTVQPKDFIEGPVHRYLGSQTYRTDLDNIVQKQIEKIENKQRVTIDGK